MGADVTSVHDDRPFSSHAPLLGNKRRPDAGDGRHNRGIAADDGQPDVLRDILVVGKNLQVKRIAGQRNRRGAGNFGQPVFLFGVQGFGWVAGMNHPQPEALEGNGAVHGTGVNVERTKLRRQKLPDGAFAGAGRTINGNDDVLGGWYDFLHTCQGRCALPRR